MRFRYFFFGLLAVLPFFSLLLAQERGLERIDIRPSNPEERVALIIGNNDYQDSPLVNPLNDARGIASALEEFGFAVILKENATVGDMKRAIRDFGRRLNNNSVGLFYFAGHGVQVKGENYLVPVGAVISNEEEVEYEAINAGFILAQMEAARNRMNILILDACRNNPYARSFRSGTRGLAMMNAPTGTLIAYATAPGATASDGTGKNGLYTEELLTQMRVAGNKIEDVFKRARAGVLERSNSQQVPWESSSLVGDFYFIPAKRETVKPSAVSNEVSVTRSKNATWSSEGNLYWLTFEGEQIQNETVSGYAADDLLVYHARTSTTFVLDDFGKGVNVKNSPAGILTGSENVFWKGENGLYWLVVNGVAIQHEVESGWAGKDLLVYHTKSGLTYILSDFDAHSDGGYRTAEVLRATPSAFWKASDGLYYLVVNGVSIQNDVEQSWSGNDLVTYNPTDQSTYVLTNYVNRQDDVLRPALTFGPPCSAIWRASGTLYWLYVEGLGVQTETTSSYEGDDLIVDHSTTHRRYRLQDFKNRGDNQLRAAECLN